MDIGPDAAPQDLPRADLSRADGSSPDSVMVPDQPVKWIDAGQDIPSGSVSEEVTCRFVGSTSTQQCNASVGAFCNGVATCKVKVSGTKGSTVLWKSTCGGYASTTQDGKDEAATFQCAANKDMGPKKDMAAPPDSNPTDLPAGSVSELVTCHFTNSTSTQTCYASTGHTCSGIASCITTVTGKPNTAVTWKSSCGGYAYTTLDGSDEIATFNCP